MIRIHIEARNALDARKQMMQLLGSANEPAVQEMPAPCEDVTTPAEPCEAATEPEEPIAEQPAEPQKAEAPTEPSVTAEDVRTALNDLRKQKGVEALRGILSLHNAPTFPDIRPDDYAAVLAEVMEVLGHE